MNDLLKNQFLPEDQISEQVALKQTLNIDHWLAGGSLHPWTGASLKAISPVLRNRGGELEPRPIGCFPSLGKSEALRTLEAATLSFDHGRGDWATRSLVDRLQCLEPLMQALQEHREALVLGLMWEIGKSLSECRMEFDRTLRDLRKLQVAAHEQDLDGSRLVTDEGVLAQIRRAPLGVVLCLGPYNFPLNETFVMLLPALLAGNSVILKLPRRASIWFGPLLNVFAEMFPPGVINVLFGATENLIPPLMASGKVAALGFVGPSSVANQLKAAHPRPHRLRTVLGLEAKNAAIVLPDADLDLAVRECVKGALAFNGQRCTALKILFVHRSVHEEFSKRFIDALSRLRQGMPWEEGVQLTPLPDLDKVTYLKDLLSDAVKRGATVLNPRGGEAAGTLFRPALVGPVTSTMRLWREEQFGPVVPLALFEEVDEVIHYLVEADTGQQVSLFGEDPATLGALIDPLVNQVCRVNINCKCQRNPDTFPFVGRKDSGEGPLSIPAALDAFSLPTLVAATDQNGNRALLQGVIEGEHSRFLRR